MTRLSKSGNPLDKRRLLNSSLNDEKHGIGLDLILHITGVQGLP